MTRGQTAKPLMQVEDVEPGDKFLGKVSGVTYTVVSVDGDAVTLHNNDTHSEHPYPKERLQEAFNVPTLEVVE